MTSASAYLQPEVFALVDPSDQRDADPNATNVHGGNSGAKGPILKRPSPLMGPLALPSCLRSTRDWTYGANVRVWYSWSL